MVAAAIELVDLFEESGRVDAVGPVFGEAITVCRPRTGVDGICRLIAERYRALGRPVPAIVWFVDAARAGDSTAFDDGFALFRDLELPPAGIEVRERLLELVEPQREIVAMTTFLDVELPDAARIAGMPTEATRAHELAGLAVLAGRGPTATALLDRPVHGGSRQDPTQGDPPPPDSLDVGSFLRAGDYDFPDHTTVPGQVIGGMPTDDERAMINLADPEDRARYLLQRRVQEKAEMAVLLSQLQALRHQTAMTLINDIR